MAPPRLGYYGGGDGRLSMIAEDSDYQPAPKPSPSFSADQSSTSGGLSGLKRGRPGSASHSSKGSGSLPRPSADTAPPGYTLWDVTGPKGEKLLDVRNNKHIARRGGWKRLCIIGLLLLAVAVGLGVGLGVGLSRRNNNQSNNQAAPASSQPAASGPFPEGSYTLSGNLANVSTSCTSVADTWACWPYSTFDQSSGLSGVAFNWVIANASNDPTQLTISTSQNPFAISFSNATLTMLDQGQVTERYHFSVTLDKEVYPQQELVNDGVQESCWFRSTTLQAALYTRKKADSNANGTQSAAESGWGAWPGAFEVNQTIAGGKNVPTCNEANSGGARVTNGLTDQSSSDVCGCYWRNFNL